MLHIANVVSDQKFIDNQIAYHDLTKDLCLHDYFIVSWDNPKEYKYLKSTERIEVLSPKDFILRLKTGMYNAVFIHCMKYIPLQYVPKIPRHIKVFWMSWGVDIYCLPADTPMVSIPLYHKETECYLNSVRKRDIVYQKNTVSALLGRWKFNIYKTLHADDMDLQWDCDLYRKAVSRVDYFAGVFPIEYDLIKKNSCFHAKKIIYNYVNPKRFDILSTENAFHGRNILVGNSADDRNNHLDILDFFKTVDWFGRKVYLPMSYGGSCEYIEYVKRKYADILGDSLHVLETFIPLDEYQLLLGTCSVGIFMHERQQGIGNIASIIRNGGKVFLSETSVTYSHYLSRGIRVFSLQKELNQEELDSPLPIEIQRNNQKILASTNTSEYRLKNLYDIYRLLT